MASRQLASNGKATSSTGRLTQSVAASLDEKLVRDLIWQVSSLKSNLDDINASWAKRLGISEPQWIILVSIAELDAGKGVTGSEIVARLHIHAAFVTTQTKALEKAGYLTRVVSQKDARFVHMKLTTSAHAAMNSLMELKQTVTATIFSGLSDRDLKDLTDRITVVRNNSELASRRLAVEP